MQKQMHVLLCSTRERKTYFSCTTALHTATAVTHTHSENIFLQNELYKATAAIHENKWYTNTGFHSSRKQKMDAITVIVLSSDTLTD